MVGAGPADLLGSLVLSKHGIPVTLMDMGQSLDPNLRATHHSAPAVTELIRAGVIDDVKAEGFIPDGVSWRRIDGEEIVSLDPTVLGDTPSDLVYLPLDELAKILNRHLDRQKNVRILFNHEVIDIGQKDNEAWVEANTEAGVKQFKAQYITGCDGANSKIRRSLFEDGEFPGFTWDKQIVATNVSLEVDILS